MRDTRDPSNTLESLPACRASRPRRGWVQAVLLACAAGALPALSGCAGQGAKAATEMLPNESVVRVPVQVDLENGGQARGELVVTVFTPQGEGRHPLMVISHGRAGDAAGRAAGRARYATAARYFTDAGSSWPCRCGWVTAPPAVPTWKTAALAATGAYAHVQPCRERDRAGDRGDGAAAGRGSGQRGGAGPVGGRRLDRGAGGGRAGRRARRHQFRGRFGRGSGQIAWQALRARALAGNLCRLRCDHPHAHALDLYRERPVLGPEWPQRWAEAYNAAGGHAQFERLGPDGDNGHSLFTHAPEKWKPLVRDFLRAQVTPCRSRARHPARRAVPERKRGRSASIRPPRRVRPRRRWRAAPGR